MLFGEDVGQLFIFMKGWRSRSVKLVASSQRSEASLVTVQYVMPKIISGRIISLNVEGEKWIILHETWQRCIFMGQTSPRNKCITYRLQNFDCTTQYFLFWGQNMYIHEYMYINFVSAQKVSSAKQQSPTTTGQWDGVRYFYCLSPFQ